MDLSSLQPAAGSRRRRKRVGRGPGSGHGKTSCKGHKGQKARSGGSIHPGFEGGQMPLQRRLPKRGFRSRNRKEYAVINVRDLERLEGVSEITPEILLDNNVIRHVGDGIKLLGIGDISRSVTVRVHAVSAGAREKIVAAGGTVEVL